MYISKLDLENFRGIKKLPIELDKHINVFVGMNVDRILEEFRQDNGTVSEFVSAVESVFSEWVAA